METNEGKGERHGIREQGGAHYRWGGGIGKAAARRFLEEGAKFALNSRRQEMLYAAREVLDPSGERVVLFAGDASKPETARNFVAAAVERFGRVDVLASMHNCINTEVKFRALLIHDEIRQLEVMRASE